MLTLQKIAETNTTITLGWNAVPNCVGYKFTVDGKVSNTWDGTRTSVKVSKNASNVTVEALLLGDKGIWPVTTPPPVSTDPWPNWLHEVSGSSVTPPNRHFSYTNDYVELTAFSDTPKLGTDRQLVSAYLGGGAALAAEGKEVSYETKVTFKNGYQWTTGQLNWLIEWHTMSGAGAGKLSNAIGVATDYPVSNLPGSNPRWYFRPTGPSGDKNIFGPSVTIGKEYKLKTNILWSTNNGRFRVWIDDILMCDETLATLYSGDNPAFGLYLYRLYANWNSTVKFTKPIIL